MSHPDGYFALVLSPASSALLRARFATLGNPIAHHCTVRHGSREPADLPNVFNALDMGRSFVLVVTGLARSQEVEAVVVALRAADGSLLQEGFSQNAIPHVTIATDGIAEPFASNALLAAGYEPVGEGLELTATLLHVPSHEG
jgi:hypothetical protein